MERPDLTNMTLEQRIYVAALEGRPEKPTKWSTERLLLVIGFIGAIVSSLFFWGGEWKALKLSIGGVEAAVNRLVPRVDAGAAATQRLQWQVEALEDQIAPRPAGAPRRPAPTFPRSEQFTSPGAAEQQGPTR